MRTSLIAMSYLGLDLILDLYDDEPIPLVFNADDFTNIAERSSTYSKSFQIPGTKHNNLFFASTFDVKTDSSFDPHAKTRCTIKQDTIDIFNGWLQLNEISIIKDEVSYEITIYSDEVNIKDTLSEKKLRDLDFDELLHKFSHGAAINSATTGVTYINPANTYGFRTIATVKYPWVRWDNDIIWNTVNPPDYIDIPSSLAPPYSGEWWHIYRPWINVDYIFRTILADAGYTVTSAFMATNAWLKLFADFTMGRQSIGKGEWTTTEPVQPNSYGTSWTKVLMGSSPSAAGTWTTIDPADWFNATTEEMTVPPANDSARSRMKSKFYCYQNTGSNILLDGRQVWYHAATATYTYDTMFTGQVISSTPGSWTPAFWDQGPFVLMMSGDKLWMEIKTDVNSVELYNSGASGTNNPQGLNSWLHWEVQRTHQDFRNILDGPRGDMVQWDFIKNFLTMFNLVMTIDEDEPTNLILEPYDDWVDTGATHYWDDKLDTEEVTLLPIEGLAKNIRFMHEEDGDDWITINHNSPNQWKYSHLFESGDEIYDAAEEEISLKGFAATYCTGTFSTDVYVPQILNNDGDTYWGNLMRILYDNGVQTSGVGWGQHGGSYLAYLQFTMVDQYPPVSTALSYNFGVVDYDGPGGPVLNSLFNVYWSKYLDELYHKDTRIAKVKMMLTATDIHKFKFNDLIQLQSRIWRVKLIEYSGETSSIVELVTVKNL